MSDFHFIRPWWLLAIFAVMICIFLLKKYRITKSGWQQFVPAHLAKVLINDNKNQHHSLMIPFLAGLLAVIALAGPTWEKLPQPVYQVERGSVLIMDMSYSMFSTDLLPNRLTRARFKAIDLLDNINEGDIGLVAYAGDAFVISPLTEDINNIKLLLPSLSPDIMPELGSNPLAALTLAHQMLINAGHSQGDVYWFTDGIDNEDRQDITDWSREYPHSLNILGIGTKNGAPIKLSNGELMKDNSGAIVIPKLTEEALFGAASQGRGNYRTIGNDINDITALVSQSLEAKSDKQAENLNTGDQWQEAGPYLLLLLLPLVLSYFRRGSLLIILPFCLLLTPAKPVHASLWQDLWKTKDQQAQESFNKEQFKQAAEQFKDPLWQGSAHYRDENYEEALSAFKQSNSAESFYNQGNALAKLQRLDEAISAYEEALKLDPSLKDAQANKALIEQLKKQQEQQQQDDQEGSEKQENEEQNKEENQDQKNQQNNESGQDQQSEQNKEQQSSDQKDQQQSDQQNGEQSDEESKNQDQQSKQQSSEEQENDEQKSEQEQNIEETEQAKKEAQQAQTAQEQLAQEKLEQETEQKHMQLLNKVTDDPYLLLRNKMQLEYQKRNHNRSSTGAEKQW